MVSLLRSLNNDLPQGSALILIFSVYSLVNKSVLLCKWVLESGTRNINILRKPPYIYWFSNMLIGFWLCSFVIKLYFLNDISNQLFHIYRIKNERESNLRNTSQWITTLLNQKVCKNEVKIPKILITFLFYFFIFVFYLLSVFAQNNLKWNFLLVTRC